MLTEVVEHHSTRFEMPETPKVRKPPEFPSPEQRRDLQHIFDLLEVIRSIQPQMSIQLAQTLLLVAIKDSAGTKELHQATQWRMSTVSRHLMDLGPEDRSGAEGLGLVERRYKDDRRYVEYHLTPKGREILNRIILAYRKPLASV